MGIKPVYPREVLAFGIHFFEITPMWAGVFREWEISVFSFVDPNSHGGFAAIAP